LSGADRANVGVGLSVKVLLVFAAAKDFGYTVEFKVDF
jgi:hypothetical protein